MSKSERGGIWRLRRWFALRNARAMLAGEGLTDGFVDLVVNGQDGPIAALALGVYGSVPVLHMNHVGGGSVTVTFGRVGNPMINVGRRRRRSAHHQRLTQTPLGSRWVLQRPLKRRNPVRDTRGNDN